MPEFKKDLNMAQLFNFKKDQQVAIGALRTLTIGSLTFMPDMTVTDPTGTATDVSQTTTQTAGAMTMVAGLSSIAWDLGDTNPVRFEGFVSVRNRQMINSLLYTSLIDINLSIGFVTYDYDPLKKSYYVCFATGGHTTAASVTGVRGLVGREAANIKLTMTDELCQDVNSPKMYKFTLEVVPQPLAQLLYLASSFDDKVIKGFGRQGPVGAP